MSHRDPRRPFTTDPEEDAPAPVERPRRPSSGSPPRQTPDPAPPDRAGAFPWRTGESVADRLRRPASEQASPIPSPRPRPGLAPDADDAALPLADALRRQPTSSLGALGTRRTVPTPPDLATPPPPAGSDPTDPTDPAAWSEVTEAWAADTGQGWEEEAPAAVPPSPPAPRRARARAATASDRTRPRPRARAAVGVPEVRLPAFVAGSNLASDRTALALLAAGLVGLAAMALLLATRRGDLAPTLVLHLDAAGRPDRWGPPRVLWRIPLLVAMTTLMNLTLAWWLARDDRFAARFLLAAALVVQLIAWVALFDFL